MKKHVLFTAMILALFCNCSGGGNNTGDSNNNKGSEQEVADQSSSDTFKEDEFIYKNISTTYGSYVDIIGYEGTSSEITIPLSISHLGTTYKVRNVESLNENKYIKKVIMPQTDEMFYEFECFENCSNLKEIETHNQLYNGLSFKGTSLGDAVYSSDSTTLYAVNQSVEEFKVSYKTKTIESHAFEKCMVKKVHIPNGVEEIHDYCFVDCENLATIDTICTYYEPRRYTEEELFAGTEFEGEDFIPAAYMRNIMENMNLEWDGEMYVEIIDNSNRLPNTVKQAPYCLFVDCNSIEDFSFDHFERIGLVFSVCPKLKQITISNCKCASYLFEICPSMEFVVFDDEELEELNLETGFKFSKIQSLYLPSSITKMNFDKIAEMELSIDFQGNESMIEEIAKAKREHEAQVAAQKRAAEQEAQKRAAEQAAQKRAAEQAASSKNSNSSSTSSSKEDRILQKMNEAKDEFKEIQAELTIHVSMYRRRDLQGELLVQKLKSKYDSFRFSAQDYIKILNSQGRDNEAFWIEYAIDDMGKRCNMTISAYESLN